jgi:hypothetical protein
MNVPTAAIRDTVFNTHNWHETVISKFWPSHWFERKPAVRAIRIFLDLLILLVAILMAGDPTQRS